MSSRGKLLHMRLNLRWVVFPRGRRGSVTWGSLGAKPSPPPSLSSPSAAIFTLAILRPFISASFRYCSRVRLSRPPTFIIIADRRGCLAGFNWRTRDREINYARVALPSNPLAATEIILPRVYGHCTEAPLITRVNWFLFAVPGWGNLRAGGDLLVFISGFLSSENYYLFNG